MQATKTITICGKQVEMIYCAAVETGYEQLVSGTGKDINVFLPTILERDADGNVTKFDPPTATTDDYIKLACASIVAAATRKKQEPAVTSDDILFYASSAEVQQMVATIIELRIKWYTIPEAVKPETNEQQSEGDPKNA